MNNPLMILYLEDNPRDVELVRGKLQQLGMACELRVASNRAEYEAALAQTRFDLILSDYSLPDYDGMAALALARVKQPDIPFILLSGTLGEEAAVDCVLRGATDYVLKQRLSRLVPAMLRAITEAEEHRKLREAEDDLRESEDRYRLLFEASSDGIVLVDSKTKVFSQVNPAMCRILGYTAEELTTMRVEDIHPKEDLPAISAGFEAAGLDGMSEITSVPCLRKDGKIVYAEINSNTVILVGRKYNIAIFRDITERKLAEEEREKMLRWQLGINLLQQSLLATGTLNHKLKIITDGIVGIFGADFCRIWLIRPGDLCKRGCIHTELKKGLHVCHYRDHCLHLMASSGRYTHIDGKDHRRVPFGAYKIGLIASGEDHKLLTNDVTNDPRVHNHEWARELGLVSFAGYQIRIPDGETLGVLALFAKHPLLQTEDALLDSLSCTLAQVIKQSQAEEALRENERKLSKLISSMEQGLAIHEIILDENGVPIDYRYIDVNPAFERVTGLKKESIIGKTVLEILTKFEILLIEKYRHVALTGEVLHLENYFQELGKYFEIIAYRPEFNTLVTIISDITERKKAEAEKANLELQLRESQKIEAVGQLAGGISHDFNNLLSVINGYSQVLLMNPKLNADTKLHIEEILRAGERAAGLTRQLLVFSRREAVESRIIDLDAIISGIEKMLRRLIRENIIVKRDVSPNLWKIKADSGNIEQVIMNLVLNASDAMPNGGTLTVGTENIKIDETNRLAHPAGIKSGLYVMLSVSDTGCGMDDKVREHIFEPFFTTKEVGKGTGLGLATVYGIVKQGNGYIDVQSELGKGARFRIYFPQVADEGAANKKQLDTPIMPRGGETILLAEDKDSLRKMLQEFLPSLGYTVLPACNGKEALELLKKHKGKIHLLLTDVVMPGMNGFELAKDVKNLLPEIKLLFMSGYNEPSDRQTMMRINGNFIQKPLNLDKLSVKIREILDK